MCVPKYLLLLWVSLWVSIGAFYAYRFRDDWLPQIRDAKLLDRAMVFLAVFAICMIVAPLAHAFFKVFGRNRYKE